MDVSAVAKGYLSLINANNRGQGITQAADYITPVVDVSAMLGTSTRGLYATSAVINVGGGSSIIGVVPDGQVWIVRAGSLFIDPLATGVCNRVQGWCRPPGSVNTAEFCFTEPSSNMTGPAQHEYRPWLWPGLPLEGGTELYVNGEVTVANCNVGMTLLFDRLRA